MYVLLDLLPIIFFFIDCDGIMFFFFFFLIWVSVCSFLVYRDKIDFKKIKKIDFKILYLDIDWIFMFPPLTPNSYIEIKSPMQWY